MHGQQNIIKKKIKYVLRLTQLYVYVIIIILLLTTNLGLKGH